MLFKVSGGIIFTLFAKPTKTLYRAKFNIISVEKLNNSFTRLRIINGSGAARPCYYKRVYTDHAPTFIQ